MTSITITFSAASATPSSTTQVAAAEPPNDDRLWPLALFAFYIFALIGIYYFMRWLYHKVDLRVKDHRRIKRQEVEMRKRRPDWELYP